MNVSKILQRISKKILTRLMDKLGGRLVSQMTDTSSDAPSGFSKPKRDLYSQIQKNTDSPEESK